MIPPPPTSSLAAVVVGRLAPSPTGILHLGNLSTFGLAWLQARVAKGNLLLRIEDLDAPRTVEGCEDTQRRALQALGIRWDNAEVDVVRQSARNARYLDALHTLAADGLIYPCSCSRRVLHDAVSAPHGGQPVYPGTCRPARLTRVRFDPTKPVAWRMYAPPPVRFSDGFAGDVSVDAQTDGGDFVVRRRDGLVGYQLATAVDDGDASVTDIVRGRDLLSSTPRQWAIQQALGLTAARPWHAPLVTGLGGHRLAKRDGSLGWPMLASAGWSPDDFWGAMALLWGFTQTFTPRSLASMLPLWNPVGLRRSTIAVDTNAFQSVHRFVEWAAVLRQDGPHAAGSEDRF